MKLREGFVSNSSSASFTVLLADLSPAQYDALIKYPDLDNMDWWQFHEDGCRLFGWTVMDNGDLADFLEDIGLNPNYCIEGD